MKKKEVTFYDKSILAYLLFCNLQYDLFTHRVNINLM